MTTLTPGNTGEETPEIAAQNIIASMEGDVAAAMEYVRKLADNLVFKYPEDISGRAHVDAMAIVLQGMRK